MREKKLRKGKTKEFLSDSNTVVVRNRGTQGKKVVMRLVTRRPGRKDIVHGVFTSEAKAEHAWAMVTKSPTYKGKDGVDYIF